MWNNSNLLIVACINRKTAIKCSDERDSWYTWVGKSLRSHGFEIVPLFAGAIWKSEKRRSTIHLGDCEVKGMKWNWTQFTYHSEILTKSLSYLFSQTSISICQSSHSQSSKFRSPSLLEFFLFLFFPQFEISLFFKNFLFEGFIQINEASYHASLLKGLRGMKRDEGERERVKRWGRRRFRRILGLWFSNKEQEETGF